MRLPVMAFFSTPILLSSMNVEAVSSDRQTSLPDSSCAWNRDPSSVMSMKVAFSEPTNQQTSAMNVDLPLAPVLFTSTAIWL